MRRYYVLRDVSLSSALYDRFREWGKPPEPIALKQGEWRGGPGMKWWGTWPAGARRQEPMRASFTTHIRGGKHAQDEPKTPEWEMRRPFFS